MKRIIVLFLMLVSSILVFSQTKAKLQTGTILDIRDGKSYKTVKIGMQYWMSENLNFQAENSYCYGDDPNNCTKYGRLYEWDAAKLSCPAQWRLPADSDWLMLTTYIGGTEKAGYKLNIYGPYGFKGLFAGRRVSYGEYFYLGTVGIFWTATEADKDNAITKTIAPGNQAVVNTNYSKYNAYSVRCVADSVSVNK
jgi:uncharacterized protein (TIGR02145 family)